MVRYFLLSLVICGIAYAAPPPNADPSLAPWFQGLKQPGTGIGCCSISDCRAEKARVTVSGYEVEIDGDWVAVPEEKIVRGIHNPTYRDITCHVGKMIFCFVPGPEA